MSDITAGRNENYINENGSEESRPENRKPSLLLHSCCGPCSTAVIERLADRYDLTVYFYNPNITDREEYERRLEAQHQVLQRFNEGREEYEKVAFEEGPYDPENYFEAVKGFETEPENGSRCDICFRVRMEKTAELAEKNGFDEFATTLSVSPHKNTNRINAIGYDLEKEVRPAFLDESFKKKDGFRRSVELSKEYGIYRQNYCGCVFSVRE